MSKKGENIYRRKDGRWEGRFKSGTSSCGKALYRSVYGNSYLEVKEKIKSATSESEFKTDLSEELTVAGAAEKWLDTRKIKCKQSTCVKYYNICKNHIIPSLGSVRIAELNSENIEKMLDERKNLSPKTRVDILGVVKTILSFSKSLGTSCGADLSKLSVKAERKPIRVFSVNEQRKLMVYLKKNESRTSFGVLLTLCTGIRIGELCALKSKDISFENSVLCVERTMQRIQTPGSDTKTKVIVSSPKSGSSVREIPLTRELLNRAAEYTKNTDGESYFLTGEKDRFIEPAAMRYHFSKILSDCGIKNAHFHTLRHTFATRCVEAGVDVKTLSEILGHENVNITLNRYVHSTRDFKRENMKKLFRSEAYSPALVFRP